MTSPAIMLEDCWAKTDPATGAPALTVEAHCRLVGAVAKALFNSLPVPVRHMLPSGCVTLVAAHDLGKITPGFQLKCPSWRHHTAISSTIHHNGLETNHAKVGAWHLAHADPAPMPRTSARWLVSTGGHHGAYLGTFEEPPKKIFEGTRCGHHPEFLKLREELLQSLIGTFGPLPTASSKGEFIRAHLLTGFTIFADWIGSNADWFPFSESVDPASVASRTRLIVADQFAFPAAIRQPLTFGALFTSQNPDDFKPRKLQEALIDAAESPGLYIVEAPMGSGKTEAALAAGYRRWTEGDERGLYFALPTQLTSARIHDRVQVFLSHILEGSAFQTLIHGNAWLADHRIKMVSGSRADGAPHAEANDIEEALRWFSSTRRQLLAPFGVGTIDQALLAILPARFSALRFFALAGKVVVIDEVHSYDPYMSALIDRLISYLLPTGSSVIILSATLTAARRRALVAAAGATEPAFGSDSTAKLESNTSSSPSEASAPYPLITKVATGTSAAIHIPIMDRSSPRPVSLAHVTLTGEDSDGFWQRIADQVLRGANVVVIRNTVALAQQTYRILKSKLNDSLPRENVGLIHSRFTQAHRLANEGRWVERLGKDPQDRPRGSLLVATQIVEQSVDIDADLLVTDLAPVDLILQRLGRLHRHDHHRPSGFEVPRCYILHPPVDWSTDSKMIEAALAPHHFVYPPVPLWQASSTLTNQESILLPSDIRTLVEAAFSAVPDPEALAGFRTFLTQHERERLDQQGTAKIRDVFSSGAIDDHEGTETRWRIQGTAHLILLASRPERRGGGHEVRFLHGEAVTLPSGAFSYPLARALHCNAIRIPAYLVKDALLCLPDWLEAHIPDAVLAVAHPASLDLEILSDRTVSHFFKYSESLGLTWGKTDYAKPFVTDPEDFWF